MKKGIGRSMNVHINPFSVEPELIPEKERSVLANEKRLRILEYLINFPCAPMVRISEGTGLSLNSVRWHLRFLLENGNIEKIGRSYAPSDFIASEDVPIFMSLQNPVEYRITELIIQSGPLEKSEIRRATKMSSQLLSYHLKKLEKAGVITKVNQTYELAFDFLRFQKTYTRAVEKYLAGLAMEAKKEGVFMDIDRKRHELIVSVSIPEEMQLRITELPFYELLG